MKGTEMASLIEGLAGALGGETLGQLAGALGTDNELAGKAIAAALPAIMGGLARNSREPTGAGALLNAINTDHNGSILDNLGSIFGGNDNSDGDKILGHVLGNGRPRVEQQVAASSGMSSELVKRLLPMLAPIVLGYIGRRMSNAQSDASILGALLNNEREEVKRADGGLGGLLDLLDGDDDDGGLLGAAGDLLTGPAGRAILGQLLK